MRKATVLTNFSRSRYSDAELTILAASVVKRMTVNVAIFSTPDPALTIITAAKDELITAMVNAWAGGVDLTAIKDQKRQILEELLVKEAGYVDTVSNGDPAKILLSGFKPSRQPAPIGPLPKPENFKAEQRQTGQIELRVDKIYGANSYQWEYQQMGATEWAVTTTTGTTELLTDLESTKRYIFRVLPIGADKIRTYSDELTRVVS